MADSVHQDVLAVAKTRLVALGPSLSIASSRFVEVEQITKAWATALPPDAVLISGYGNLRPLPELDDSCSVGIAYPLTIAAVYRSKAWSVDERNLQQKVTQAILDAFFITRNRRLELTYPGASCLDIQFVGGPTSTAATEGWETILRQLNFEVLVEQSRD